MQSIRYAIPLAITIACMMAINSCRKQDSAKESANPTIGVSLLTEQHDFYKDLKGALRQTAKEKDLDVIIHSAEFDPVRQTAQVEDFITQRVDAIVICPCDSAGIVPAIQQANKAGIPVFTADIAAAGGEVVAHIASDNVQGGRLAAKTLARHLNGKGEIVILDHPEVASVQDRVRGFLEGIEQYPEIKLIDRPSAGGLRDRAFAIAENMIQAHPDLRGIFAINDDTALGALRGVGDADVVIIGYDATPEARKEILRDSALKADVVQFPERIGRQTVEAIHKHLTGKKVQDSIAVEVGIVDRQTLSQDQGS